MKYYELVVHVPQNNLTTVLEVITGSAELKSLHQLAEPKEAKRASPQANGKRRARDSNGTAKSYIMERLAKGPTTVHELRTMLLNKKFSDNTVAARISELISTKKINRDPEGKITLRK